MRLDKMRSFLCEMFFTFRLLIDFFISKLDKKFNLSSPLKQREDVMLYLLSDEGLGGSSG